MAGNQGTCTLHVLGLSPNVTKDALELHIEALTKAEVVDVKYVNGNTEAIVKLNNLINLKDETHRTISGNNVKIVPESNITKIANCPGTKYDLLKMLLPKLQTSLPDCSLKMVKEGIELSGTSGSVKMSLLHLSQQVAKFDFQAISDVTTERAKLLLSKKGKRQVEALFRNAEIQAVLSVRNDKLWVIATDSRLKSKASKILDENIHRFEVPVEHTHQTFFQSAECKEFVHFLQDKYTVTIKPESSAFVVEAMGDCSDKVKKEICDKLKSSAQHTDEICLKEDGWKLLKAYYQAEVEAFGSSNDDDSMERVLVTLTSQDEKHIIKVSGDITQNTKVKIQLMKFVERILHQTVAFSCAVVGLSKYMIDGQGCTIIRGIEVECKSIISVTDGNDDVGENEGEEALDTTEDNATTSGAEQNNEHESETSSKIVLEVQQGDLTAFQADVLVNTLSGNNMDFIKCGQISNAFYNICGKKIQELYEVAVSDQTDVTVTRACGDLQCSHVFHMRIHSFRMYSFKQLESDIYKCLHKASELRANSIAFPTIGCGRLCFDANEVAQCFKRAIKMHDSDDSCYISKVTIVAYDGKQYQEYAQSLAVPRKPPPPVRRRMLRFLHPTHAPRSSSSQPAQISSVFHITALDQSHISATVDKLKKHITEFTDEATVFAEHLEMFTSEEIEDIKSLSTEELRVIIENPQTKYIQLVGLKHAMNDLVAAVEQKVKEIEGMEEFFLRKGKHAYLNHIAECQVRIPNHWKSVKNRREENAARMPVDAAVAKAVEDVVLRTWQQHNVGHGSDAKGLNHTTIEVTQVEQIENANLYLSYMHKRKELCARAANGNFLNIASNPTESPVLTSTLGISELDDQLIPEINEYFLFHGTPQDVIDSIVNQGIDYRLTKRVMFGKGAYFCESATKADQYTDDRNNRTPGPHSMFMSKVILGRSYIANAPVDLNRPPCLHHCTDPCKHGPSEFYDSVVGTHKQRDTRLLFREFIIYDKVLCYPAYLITYNRK